MHTFATFRRVTGLKVPERCKLCGAAGTVVPETTITGGVVLLKWFCRACGDEWPMTNAEQRLVEQKEMQSKPTAHPQTQEVARREKDAVTRSSARRKRPGIPRDEILG